MTQEERRLHALDRPSEPNPAREAHDALEGALFEIKRVIVGQEAMLERVLVALLAGGHVLLEGVPGLAKTLTVKTVVPQLKANGKIPRAWLGVSTTDTGTRDGAVVGDVTGAPAQDAGIQRGDVIIQFDGKPITSASDLGEVVLTRKPGDTVKVVVDRNGSEQTLTVKLGNRPNQPTNTLG